jgi:thiosulfate/3-mercaptopyruvate sulfurtransferase
MPRVSSTPLPSPPASPLVRADWLAEHLADPRVRIADVRWYLAGKKGADEYARGHVPGAVFVDLDRDLAAPGSGPGRHPLPSAADFARVLARIGVDRGTIVVAYDDMGGAIAARLWWLLRYFGHGGGRVLDGGLAAWTAAGGSLTTEIPAIAPAPPLDLAPGGAGVVDKHAVDRLRREASALVLDARARDRFEGRNETIDARPGHIPGARSAPFAENLVAPGGALLPAEALRARYEALGALSAETVVCYCGSGVTACHDLLALTLAGRADALLYEGSWSDWSRDAALPAASGEEL